MKAAYCHYRLDFFQPAITSRTVMLWKDTYFIKLWEESTPEIYGIGECALFKGLGADDRPNYETTLSRLCERINRGDLVDVAHLDGWSSIAFGYETALRDLATGGRRQPFPSDWACGKKEIVINGLVWMGNAHEMLERIHHKLTQGFRCLKLKIGGIDFAEELALLRYIRDAFGPDVLELRVDANGAFVPVDAMRKLDALSKYVIHSIEQPVKQGQWSVMHDLCRESPIPIALDEELIGISGEQCQVMLDVIRPAYVILKPSLCGGFAASDNWIKYACERGIGWWATSALESNVGLNAIAQWVSQYDLTLPQGLGTGLLYTNNILSPLYQIRDVLCYDTTKEWAIPELPWIEP
ncbi:MAG: o-succinylbenzoate synthase [Muribaculaceae bacterium]|nr:o-succinylbenzoate synthase [Muribaculaceae bacterium]